MPYIALLWGAYMYSLTLTHTHTESTLQAWQLQFCINIWVNLQPSPIEQFYWWNAGEAVCCRSTRMGTRAAPCMASASRRPTNPGKSAGEAGWGRVWWNRVAIGTGKRADWIREEVRSLYTIGLLTCKETNVHLHRGDLWNSPPPHTMMQCKHKIGQLEAKQSFAKMRNISPPWATSYSHSLFHHNQLMTHRS